MYTYSIVPLAENCFEDVCADIKDQYERGISTMPLFKMVLVPEGTPVWNKAEKQCKLYARYRDALEPLGVKTGVLIQASLGHDYSLVPAPFQRIVYLTDGEAINAWCPEDKNFVAHFKEVVRRIATERPGAIMLDDDVRLIMRPGRGCVCPLHMAEFKKRTGLDMTREEMYTYFKTHNDDDPITMEYINMQRDSLVKFVTEMREAIDSVDPTIQGINCTSGDECDSVIYTNPIFAGKGNPTIVRVPNGTYAPITVRGFSDTMRRACVCSSKLKKNGIDIVLAETDTVPFNRYAKNARYLHAHYTASMLDGLMGAKHWITRFCDNELASGKAYRDILAKHISFYDKVSELSRDIRWVGANSMFIEQKHHSFSKDEIWSYHRNDWVGCVLERMGIPFYYSEQNTGAAFLEGDIVKDMTKSQIEEAFKGSVFMSWEPAEDLIDRGYGKLIGVEVSDFDGVVINGETFDGTIGCVCTVQKNARRLTLADDKTEVLSYNYAKEREAAKIISPAVTVYPRDNSKISVVYCGEPRAEFTYTEGFAFLNETRKKQFVDLLSRADALPVYYDGDNEICMRAGYIKDGRLLTAVFNLSYDPLEQLDLYLKDKPQQITLINSDGSESGLNWTRKADDKYCVDVRVEPLYPVVLLIK